MSTTTKIEWCHHTFNPWWGCTKVSPGCANCYAERLAHRFGHDVWGPQSLRRLMSPEHWRKPFAWNRAAEKAGERRRVFCASMADVFEDLHPGYIGVSAARKDLWELIERTPSLDWLLLTKRPENMWKLLPNDWGNGYPNVWLGVTAEDQRRADERIPVLLRTPAAVRFVSYEPALEPVTLHGEWFLGLDWVIAGAESGPGARPMDLDWVRSVRDQCASTGTYFFFKQAIDHGRKVSLPVLDGRRWTEFPR